ASDPESRKAIPACYFSRLEAWQLHCNVSLSLTRTHSYDEETAMRTIIGWTVGAACATVIVTGVSAPAPAQETKNDRQEVRQDSREIRGDRKEVGRDTQEGRGDRKDLEASRQRLRDAYKSGDAAAIKAARENYQKNRSSLRGDLKE